MDVGKTVLVVGLVGVAGYVAYRAFSGGSAVAPGAALPGAGTAPPPATAEKKADAIFAKGSDFVSNVGVQVADLFHIPRSISTPLSKINPVSAAPVIVHGGVKVASAIASGASKGLHFVEGLF